MQPEKSESRPRRVWLLGAAVFFVALAALWLRPPAPEVYTRYLSPPLPDGTRYTFLYPTWMTRVSQQGVGQVQVGEAARGGPGANIFQEALRLWRNRRKSNLAVGQDAFVMVFYRPLKVFKGPDERKEQRWERNGTLRHNIFIADARTKMKFFLFHNGLASERTRFEEIDPVIARSFRLLPPGAPVPSP